MHACLPYQLNKAYAVLWAASRFDGLETPKHNVFDQFENFNSISNIFWETIVIRNG